MRILDRLICQRVHLQPPQPNVRLPMKEEEYSPSACALYAARAVATS